MEKRTASVLDTNDPNFDGIFIQATALNPHLALLLGDEQLIYARNAIEKQLNERMRAAEEVVARRAARLNGGVDALLATVVDRAAASSGASSSSSSDSNCGNEVTACQNIAPSTSLYPDLERQQAAVKNRYAEAIVQSYFDELAVSFIFIFPRKLKHRSHGDEIINCVYI
ncbi:unnamed protein product [Gongylonema pulchrum]|uniref:Uncharacterized protein n=1 Tax=Gongylonema pulchrum TaxID=637853 RepID=A0A3P7P7D6_9BILA|nr:unnamed protein product [Gongylonema pulchrum]